VKFGEDSPFSFDPPTVAIPSVRWASFTASLATPFCMPGGATTAEAINEAHALTSLARRASEPCAHISESAPLSH